MGDGPPRSTKETDTPRAGLDDTIPASEPPLDADGNSMRGSRQSIPPHAEPRYRHGVELGRGGMGRVVEAFDTQLGRTVALKEVLPKGGSVERRFLREVQITARLEHPAIVPLYDSGTTPDGRPYYVMRRVTGRPLDELITRARGFGERLTLLPNVLAAIDAIAHAHKRGVIHRDLKPANILVGEHGETVVIDWGLAKVVGEEDIYSADPKAPITPVASDSLQTQVGSVFGTPGFMAPEQARGEELGPHSDVYALGATLYQVLAGAPAHRGTSATEVLGKTLKHDVIPLGEIAEGTPPELIAIVDKALAFDEQNRYPDASALAEDVRRFLAGQLVAAHRYTSRQRLARFARKHRTALAVAALATVAVAVLAWFSVHRIMSERDRAEDASLRAVHEKQAAEDARDRLADRNDALLILQARALLDSNPTEALSVLKQLSPTSARLPDAHALAKAAVTRGVWSAIRSTDAFTVRLVLSPDGRQLLQLARDEVLRVWDLDRRQLVLARPHAFGGTAVWMAGNRVLLYGSTIETEILEPSANQSVPSPLGRLRHVEVSEDGAWILLQDTDQRISLYEVATATRTPLMEGRRGKDFLIAPDGTWAVVGDGTTLFVYDRAGRELTRHAAGSGRMIASHKRAFAFTNMQIVLECRLDPHPTWKRVPLPEGQLMAGDMSYRGAELVILMRNGQVLGWSGTGLWELTRIPEYSIPMHSAGSDLAIITTSNDLTIVGDGVQASLQFPHAVSNVRIAARRGLSRIVVAGTGVLLVLDLDQVVPREVPEAKNAELTYLDDDTLLMASTAAPGFAWLDLGSGTRTAIDLPRVGFHEVIDYDPPSGRILLRAGIPDRQQLVLFHKGSTKVTHVAKGRHLWGRLLIGDAVAFGSLDPTVPDGRVMVMVGTGEVRQLLSLDDNVTAVVSIARSQLAVATSKGELVRTDVNGSVVERINVDPATEVGGLAADAGGRVVVLAGRQLFLWDRAISEIATFDQHVSQVVPVEAGGLLVLLHDQQLHFVAAAPRATPRRLMEPTRPSPRFSGDGGTVLVAGNGFQLTLIDVAANVRWQLPRLVPSAPNSSNMEISPSGRYVIQTSTGVARKWTIPQIGSDFGAWLDEQTNASKQDDGMLAWPWQLRTVPP